jgi:hypothetical protein
VSRFLLLFCALSAASGFQAPSVLATFPGTAADLARFIRDAGLDPAECYRVRDLSFTKDDIRLYFNDGYLIFSKPVLGQRLAAVFTADVEGGDGEVIVIPPTHSERQSLAAYTQSPNLDEHFRAAMMIFSDGSMERLRSDLERDGAGRKAPEMGPVMASQWAPVVSNISGPMQMRLIGDLLAARPADTGVALIAVSGKTLGNFDVIADARANGRIVVRQHSAGEGNDLFHVWTSFLPRRVSRNAAAAKPAPAANDFTLPRYRIDTEIDAGMSAKVVTRALLRVGANPARAFPFEIARAMQVTRVRIDGVEAEVLRDDSLRGRITANGEESEFLVIAPATLAAGSEHEIEFEHHGNVIATRGSGVYFVNARGAWYPRVSAGYATYDLTFRYPKRLTLVTAGDPVEDRVDGEWRVTRRRTAVAIGAAGFNLGVYEKVTGTAAGVSFEVYGNRNLEDALRPKVTFTLPTGPPVPSMGRGRGGLSQTVEPNPPVVIVPDPRGRLQAVAGDLSASLEFFSGLFGPPVMKTLTVAPIPGTFGQGFPGLVYLSTFAYIEPNERPAALRNAREQVFFSDLIVPHETAHQWWGSIIATEGTEDDWLLEALANYSSLLWMEKKKGLREMEKVLNGYRDELLSKAQDGAVFESAGPIVWGDRLAASPNPNAWRVITYGKGTWILHMLRRRIGDDAFFKTLAELRRRYEFKTVTTADVRALVREFRPKSVSAEAVDAFFDNWVYATGIPALKLKYTVKGVAPALKLSGTLEQSGVADDFSADIPVEIQNGRGAAQTIWVRTAGKETAFTANLRQSPTRVMIPDDVLMTK